MFEFRLVLNFLLICVSVYGKSIIDNGTQFIELTDAESNSIERVNEDCSILSPELIAEIKSHQPLVDKLTQAIVNGEYSGDTWNA